MVSKIIWKHEGKLERSPSKILIISSSDILVILRGVVYVPVYKYKYSTEKTFLGVVLLLDSCFKI